MRKNNLYGFAIIIITALMFLSGCSNMLTSVYLDPEDLRPKEPMSTEQTLAAQVYASVDYGTESAEPQITVEIIWNREVSAFEEADLLVDNAAISSFAGSGDTYSFTLSALSEGITGFSIDKTSLGAEGLLDDDILYQYIFKPGALSLSISSDETVLTNSASIPLYFDFSGETADFEEADVSVLGATMSGFGGSGDSFFGTLNFTADTEVTVSVNAGAAHNPSFPSFLSGSASFSITYDGSNPEASLSTTISDGDSTGYGSLAFTLDLTEELDGLDSSIITVTNGTLSGFAGSADRYTFDITPDAAGTVTVSLAAGTLTDGVGNSNTADEEFSFVYDSSMVGVNLSSSADPINNDASISLDAVFGESVTGLELSDFSVTNGTASNLSGSGDTYALTITPTGDGDVTVSLVAAAAVNGIGSPTSASSFTYQYDGTAPAAVSFSLSMMSAGTELFSGDYSGEFMLLDLLTDYSSDGGSDLTYEYTLNNGLTWSSFSLIGVMLTENKSYSGINIRVTDEAGNSTSGTARTNVSVDTVIPDAPVVIISTDPVNASNYQSFAFDLSGGESGISYAYTISSDKGGTDVTGSGSFDGSGEAAITEDLSSLNDGTVSVRVTAEDHAGNESAAGTDGVVMDRLIPAEPSISITTAGPVTSADPAIDFFITGGEEGIEYEYVITSSAGGAVLDDTGVFDGTGVVTFTDMDTSLFRDGTLTVSVTQTDAVGNESPAASDTVELDMKAVNDPDFDFAINSTNVSDGSVTLVGEPGSNYSYTIYSTGGGDTLTGTGTFDATGSETITGLDFSGMADGYLILIVDITDVSGNSSTALGFTEIDASAPPVTTTADFSLEAGAVNFDMSYHGSQTVPSGIVKYDTTGLVGTDYDDIIRFSGLEDGETFTIDGGTGFNLIDLSEYVSTDVTVNAGQTGEDDGTIVLNLPEGGTATINYTDFHKVEFSSNNFTGSPHALELDTSGSISWTFSDTFFDLYNPTANEGNYRVGLIYFEGSLGLNYTLDTTFKPVLDLSWKNGLIIFDYQDEDNYKYIRAYAGADKWEIGEIIAGGSTALASLDEIIDEHSANPLQLRVTGAEGKTAELWSGGVMKVSYTFDDVLNDGLFGLSNVNAHTEFTIDMTPSNWAPYARRFEAKYSKSAMSEITIDVIGSAVDFEGEFLEITSLSSSSNGTMTDNGDGTVTYIPNGTFFGVDTFTYAISDGTNVTTAEIRIDVLP
jgi:hypothetical protein